MKPNTYFITSHGIAHENDVFRALKKREMPAYKCELKCQRVC